MRAQAIRGRLAVYVCLRCTVSHMGAVRELSPLGALAVGSSWAALDLLLWELGEEIKQAQGMEQQRRWR